MWKCVHVGEELFAVLKFLYAFLRFSATMSHLFVRVEALVGDVAVNILGRSS